MAGIKKYLPKTLIGRSTLIVILPVLILQVATIYIFFDRHWDRMVYGLSNAVAGEVAVISNAIQNSNDRIETVKDIQELVTRSLDMSLRYMDGATVVAGNDRGPFLQRLVLDKLTKALQVRLNRPFDVLVYPDDKKYVISVQLFGGVLEATVAERRLYSSSSYVFLVWMVGISILLTLISMIFLRNQIRPIRKLAAAADRFGRGLDAENFKPEGAREVRAAGHAFIQMRDRIKRQVEQRTVMLAGVSHDMRTPLTRMKLALSLLPQNEDVDAIKADVSTMEHMLVSYLEFVKGEAEERAVATDLSALLADVIAREQMGGFEIVSDIPDGIYMTVRPVAVARAVQNILGNARHYGTRARVQARLEPNYFVITVDDNGPGIDPVDYDRALRPFVRLDPGRTVVGEGGVGLGLAIARDMMQAHGGDLALGQAPDLGGLRVVMTLPR
jgi:two-component system osmolarity sensor histidine kinase EnvZ